MATATTMAPSTVREKLRVVAATAAADAEIVATRAPFVGTVAVAYSPDTVLTGANTESRTLSAINKGQAGAGVTEVASKAFTAGVSAPAFDETVITASVVALAVDVADGDIISFKSTAVGATGLAQPAGLVVITFTRA